MKIQLGECLHLIKNAYLKDGRMDVLLLQKPVVQGFPDKDMGVTQLACHTNAHAASRTVKKLHHGVTKGDVCSPTGAYVPEGLMTSCSWDYMTFTPSVRSYTMLLFTFVFFIPLSIIIFCYCCIFRAIRHTTRFVHTHTHNTTCLRLVTLLCVHPQHAPHPHRYTNTPAPEVVLCRC